jgi:DNA-binding NtrC family response regulator
MSDIAPRVAIIVAPGAEAPAIGSFTAVCCSSASETHALEFDLILIDLTRGWRPELLPVPSSAVPCIAVLRIDASSEEVELSRQRFTEVSVGWPTPGEILRRASAVRNEKELSAAEDALLEEMAVNGLLGQSPAFRAAVAKIPLLGRSGAPVLIVGETGTGKELCARALHFSSRRRDGPFLAVDCAAIPDHLFENELFGHVRGAYTDANAAQKGIIGLADHGTLFLDEVDSLTLAAQGKLLRFLEERRYRPLGAECFLDADLRILAATNSHLPELVEARQFRRDLYFRLNVLAIELPPLRQRPEDIALLAKHFIVEAAREIGMEQPPQVPPEALRLLLQHDWPGNVRELQNVMWRAVVLCDGNSLDMDGVGSPTRKPPCNAPGMAPGNFKEARGQAVNAFEREFIEQLLTRNNGNITRAAREAGKERRAFGRLVKKHGLGR